VKRIVIEDDEKDVGEGDIEKEEDVEDNAEKVVEEEDIKFTEFNPFQMLNEELKANCNVDIDKRLKYAIDEIMSEHNSSLKEPTNETFGPMRLKYYDSVLKRQENFIDFLDKEIKERSFLKRIKDKIGKLKKGEDNIDNNFFNRMESALSYQKMYKNESE